MERDRLIVPITPYATSARGYAARVTAPLLVAELARITDRDRLILDLLAEHRALTTEHVAALAFGSANRARTRLNLLHERGVLDRFRHYVASGSQAWRWTLGPIGAALIAGGRGDPMPRPAAVRDATARLATSPTLAHLLTTNGFFVALTAHARTHPDASLDRWWSETRVREATGNLVRPDGHGVWRAAGRMAAFWLETDMGTEPLTRVIGKLADYAHLAGTDRAYPVLFWLTTPAREANLHALFAHHGLPAGVTVATATTAHAADGDGPAGPVWLTPGHSERVTLAQLAAPPSGPRP